MAGLYIEKIKEIIIGSEKYFFMDVWKADGTKMQGCLLKKIYGIPPFALFQWGEIWNPENAVVLLPQSTDSTLNFAFIAVRKFNKQYSWASLQFKDCAELKELIQKKVSGWLLPEKETAGERVELWKKYIDKYNSCINR